MKYPFQSPFVRGAFSCLDNICSFLPSFSNDPLEPKSFLICNLGHLGDIVLTTSLLAPIKKAYPNAHIGVLVGSWSHSVVKNHPLIDSIYFLDHWKTNRSSISFKEKYSRYSQTRRETKRALTEKAFDVAIDCRSHFPNCAPLLWQLKIPCRIGFSSAGFGSLLTHTYPWTASNEPLVESFFSLLRSFPEIQKEKAFLKPHLKPSSSSRFPSKSYLLFHPGRGEKIKEWPLKKWRLLAERLASDQRLLVWTGHGEEEQARIQTIIQDLPHCIDLSNQLKWDDYVSLIEHAHTVISVDTVTGHIGAAFDVPTLILQNGIYPEKLWLPYSKKAQSLCHKTVCAPCLQPGGCPQMSCIKGIAVSDVIEQIGKEESDTYELSGTSRTSQAP